MVGEGFTAMRYGKYRRELSAKNNVPSVPRFPSIPQFARGSSCIGTSLRPNTDFSPFTCYPQKPGAR